MKSFTLFSRNRFPGGSGGAKRDTRRYAKRQLTWFKRDARIHWIFVDQEEARFDGILQNSPCIFEKARYDRKIEGPLPHRLFCYRDKLKKGGLSPTAFSVNLFCVFG
ncbi:MAG: hypothetical protein ACLUFA_01330 [[Clostridium] leptum]